MLLCHGGPGQWDYLEPVAEMLPEFTVHRFDQRGCGRSSGRADYTVARAVEDVEDLRWHWGYPGWCVFGHSWGAIVALAYAWTYPDRVRRLVYCASVGPGIDWKAVYRETERARLTPGQIERRQQLEQADRDRAEEVEYLTLCWRTDYADREAGLKWAHLDAASAPFRVNVTANRRLCAEVDLWSTAEVAARCQLVTAPTVVIHGEADPRPLWNARRIAGMIAGGQLITVPGAGHVLWRENAADFAAVLRSFLLQG